MKNRQVTVFRSTDPDDFAKAVTILKAARIHHRIVDRQEGGSKSPRRAHLIMVSVKEADAAQQILSRVPSEIILPKHRQAASPADRTLAWLQLTPLIIIIVYALIRSLTN